MASRATPVGRGFISLPTPGRRWGIPQPPALGFYVVLTDKDRFRLDQESILWLTTVRKDGQPQSFPVWYVLDGDDILVWSVDGQRIANLGENPKVSAHVSDDGLGSKVLTIEATAVVDESRGPAKDHGKYVDRYQSFIDRYGWTWESFGADYKVPVVISPSKVRSS